MLKIFRRSQKPPQKSMKDYIREYEAWWQDFKRHLAAREPMPPSPYQCSSLEQYEVLYTAWKQGNGREVDS